MPQKNIDPLIRNKLIMVILFLKHKAEDKGLEPVISVKKLIDLMGMHITYSQLTELINDPSISGDIKSINKNQVTLSLGDKEENVPEVNDDFSPEDFDNSSESEMPEEEDEFSPEDFEAPTDNNLESEPPDENQEREDVSISSGGIVNSMAKRAASRK